MMPRLDIWARRPPEEANLFGPSFLCALSHEFLRDFIKDGRDGTSLFLLVIALSTVLHRSSRERLPYSTVTSLYAWVQDNEDLLIGFASRAQNLTPYLKEAVLFGLATKTVIINEAGNLRPGKHRATFPKSFLDDTTTETKEIIDRSKFMGRWLAKSGSETSVAAALGVRP
ncbi:three component ABC system middle component [Pseudaminobacter sp. NGMCC 1.201702]|uniref:three component ABC system middle component n=1 Tax=Pseudaminobacter sp. NGMCC 1.201702 TaxID=3391825 RepID=UPI0039EEDB11